jgi:hypothetical protein
MEEIMKPCVAVLALLLSSPLVAAGQSPPVAVGARIRVTAPASALEKRVMTVTDVRGDSIVVDVGGSSHTLWLSDLTKLEVSSGTRTNAARGAGFGLLMGVVAGAVIGLATYQECVPEGFMDCFMEGPGFSAVGGALVGGAAGAVIGGVVGSRQRSDRWSSVALPVRAVVAPTRSGGVSVILSRAF